MGQSLIQQCGVVGGIFVVPVEGQLGVVADLLHFTVIVEVCTVHSALGIIVELIDWALETRTIRTRHQWNHLIIQNVSDVRLVRTLVFLNV